MRLVILTDMRRNSWPIAATNHACANAASGAFKCSNRKQMLLNNNYSLRLDGAMFFYFSVAVLESVKLFKLPHTPQTDLQ